MTSAQLAPAQSAEVLWHEDKKHKKGFNFFSEQTRSAFKDIQLMYSSFFGHGWNLSRAEFWRGFNIVEQFYARHPT